MSRSKFLLVGLGGLTTVFVTLPLSQTRNDNIALVNEDGKRLGRGNTKSSRQHTAPLDENAKAAKLPRLASLIDSRKGPQYGNDQQGFLKRSRVFLQLWRERNKRNITPQLLEFLNDPAIGIREHAARALGVLERPEGEKPLVAEMDKWKQYEEKLRHPSQMPGPQAEPNFISKFTIKLSLGRIRSHKLKGRAKLDCIAKEFGFDYEGIAQMSQKLDQQLRNPDTIQRQTAARSEAYPLMTEFLNTFYVMRVQGQDLKALGAERLASGPLGEVVLRASDASPEERIRLFVDYATTAKGGENVARYLANLGPSATDAILGRLQELQLHPEAYDAKNLIPTKPPVGYALFLSAVVADDARAKTVLEQLRSHPNLWIRTFAERAETDADSGGIFAYALP